MKKSLLLPIIMLLCIAAYSQTQQGYVKTKGRMVNGQLVPGQGLKGATVSVKGRTAVLVNTDDGAFSFPVTEQQFSLDSVKKKGYQLIDMDLCPRTYKASGNPLFLVMETPEQQLQDKLTAERKIRRNLQKQLQEREDEIESLKEQQQISDEEYRQALQKLYADQESNEQLISDMAKRYSELDYDQLDEFYRQVSYCIENGELVKADSLLQTRGDIGKQVENHLKQRQAIHEQEELLSKAKTVYAADQTELADRCHYYYETFVAQHMNDTASYYLELRSSLDTTNVQWLLDAGTFLWEYTANYKKALDYDQRAVRQAIIQYGESHPLVATAYNNLGSVYNQLGEYDKTMEYYNKALQIRINTVGENHLDVALSYHNIGALYYDKGEYDTALEYCNKALRIWTNVLGDDHLYIALVYNTFGSIYDSKGENELALEYYGKALSILTKQLGEDHPDVARLENNIGVVYYVMDEFEKALEYCDKALQIWIHVLGESHPDVGISYSNVGTIYNEIGNFDKAEEYNEKALQISIKAFGENHPDVASSYNNLGFVYYNKGDYDKALEYYDKALQIRKNTIGENHPDAAMSYNNLGFTYDSKGEYDKALEYFNKALLIRRNVLGEDHPITNKTEQKIAEVQAKIKEKENKDGNE